MNELLTQLAVLLGALVGLGLMLWWQRQKGREDAGKDIEREVLRDVQERTERGREAVSTGRASGATPDERLRRNDGAW